MKHSFLPLVVTLTVAAPVTAFAQSGSASLFLDRLDRNNDGVLSRSEWRGSGSSFLAYDTDLDGYLDVDELSAKPGGKKDKPAARAADPAILMVAIGPLNDPPMVFRRVCTACHNTDRIQRARKNGEGWAQTVARMQAKEEASFTEREASSIADYLTRQRARVAEASANLGTENPELAWGVILDGGDWDLFDRDNNMKLVNKELGRLLIDRLDFDGDGSLNRGEFTLMPVAADRVAAFDKADRNNDGKVSSKELGVPRSLLEAADLDRDGAISVDELPRVRRGPYSQVLVGDPDEALALLDRNRDGKVSVGELRGGDELVTLYDRNRDYALDREELSAASMGLDNAFDGFLLRYDVDSDGKVGPREFPGPPLLLVRMDRNRDGVVSVADSPHKEAKTRIDSPESRRWRTGR